MDIHWAEFVSFFTSSNSITNQQHAYSLVQSVCPSVQRRFYYLTVVSQTMVPQKVDRGNVIQLFRIDGVHYLLSSNKRGLAAAQWLQILPHYNAGQLNIIFA
jgi:hypothetical protein